MGRPSLATIKRLFSTSGNSCAFTGCGTPLVDPTSAKVTGRICHIRARSEGGPRYDGSQTEEERHAYENLILMCPIHHDVIDADSETYSVEGLLQMKQEQRSSAWVTGSDDDPELGRIANELLVNAQQAELTGGSVVTSVNQAGGQTAHSITNIDRQVLLQKKCAKEEVVLDVFSIDGSKCSYDEHRFDPTLPFWPEDADPIGVTYKPGGKIKHYGKEFDSWDEVEVYGNTLRQKYNHYSFYKNAPHTIYLDRQDRAVTENPPNCPVFYVSFSNHSNSHVVLSEIVAIVHQAKPLLAIGESHAVLPLTVYEVEIAPSAGSYRTPAIPALKIETGDAAACHVLLKPRVQMMGGYHWFITLRFRVSEHCIDSPLFAAVM